MKRKKYTIQKIIAVICCIASFACVLYGLYSLYPVWKGRRADARLRECAIREGDAGDSPPENGGGDPAMRRVIDWEALKELNPDIMGWIYVPDTDIDYPILHHQTDIGYYLDHNYEKAYNPVGSIFTRPEQKTLQESHVILFGHNMDSGYMFGSLHKFWDAAFAEEHPVYLYTEEDARKYMPFAAYECENTDSAYQMEIADQSAYFADIEKKAGYYIRELAEAYQGRQVLTLSTCSDYGAWQNRFVVQCLRTDIWRYDDAQINGETDTEDFEAPER